MKASIVETEVKEDRTVGKLLDELQLSSVPYPAGGGWRDFLSRPDKSQNIE